jgi:hypothetical protein
MASYIVSSKELERQAAECFEGKTLNIALCDGTSLGQADTVAAWLDSELSGNGYQRYQQVLQGGAFFSGDYSYRYSDINAVFQCSGPSPITYTAAIVYFSGEEYLYGLILEAPAIVILPGLTKNYNLSIQVTA